MTTQKLTKEDWIKDFKDKGTFIEVVDKEQGYAIRVKGEIRPPQLKKLVFEESSTFTQISFEGTLKYGRTMLVHFEQ